MGDPSIHGPAVRSAVSFVQDRHGESRAERGRIVDRRRTTVTSYWALRIGPVVLGTLFVFIVACGGGDSAGASATATARFTEGMEGLQGGVQRGMPATITMVAGLRFEPTQVIVPVGTTVLWRNMSAESHTVTADPAQAGTPTNVQLPAGAAPFASENLSQTQDFAQPLTVTGEYRYVCRIHEGSGMTGTIIVQ